MRTGIFLSLFLLFSCQEEPKLYSGKAEVFVVSTERLDTLNSCYCWRTKDSLNIRILREMSFGGISVDVTAKNNLYTPSIQFYSDTNEFNGNFEQEIPLMTDSLSLSFESILDSVKIHGYLSLKSKPLTTDTNKEIIILDGRFTCVMSK